MPAHLDRLLLLLALVVAAAACQTGLDPAAGPDAGRAIDLAAGDPRDAAAGDGSGPPAPDLTPGGAEDLGPGGDGTDDESQRPPTSRAALEAWLARGLYQAWRCEPAPHDARPPGAHGQNRICSNEALARSAGPGEYPVGSASIKELYEGQVLRGYAVAVRVAAGAGGDRWYWYERSGASVYGDAVGAGLCTGCHGGAPRDFVFTQVR